MNVITRMGLIILFLPVIAVALQPEDGAVFVRVVDVGAGLCCVVLMPDDYYMVYDAGNYDDRGRTAMTAIEELVPEEEVIDLVVLSHTDADHIAAVPAILDRYFVDRVIRPGLSRSSATWRRANAAVIAAEENFETLDLNLSEVEFPIGATYRFGETIISMVCGFDRPPDDWDIHNTSETRNAGSIVIRLQYQGSSVIFCGDAVGRHIGGQTDQIIATERFMVEMASVIQIDSDVIVAPHHGADNASSTAWIQAVSPEWVIFSAGHKYEHPRATTAQRYRDFGVPQDHILRTDRGDDEGGAEWDYERQPGNSDSRGDDDIDILIRPSGEIVVEYRSP